MKQSNKKTLICVLLCVLFCAVSAFALAGCAEGGTTEKKYTVVFMNGDTQISEQTVEANKEATAPADQTKGETDEYTYTFKGWSLTEDGEVVTDFAITADTTFYAVYTSTVREYTVKFMDEEGEDTLSSAKTEYGKAATAPAAPTKDGTAKYTYTFAGWAMTKNGTVVTDLTVKGDVTYYAVYTPTINKYDVKFMLDDEQIGETQTIAYDTEPTMPEAPVKEGGSGQYVYEFDGWYKEKTGGTKVTDFTVTGDATYYARFTETLKKYAVRFIDGDGNQVGETQNVAHGSAATAPATATKTATAQYSYAFAGWFTAAEGGTEVTDFTVTEETTYYAHFTQTTNTYEVKFIVDGEQSGATQSVKYGSEATAPETVEKTATAQYSYTFAGWFTADQGGEKVEDFTVTKDAVYYAQFTENVRKYTVRFVGADGSDLGDRELSYGSEIELPEEPAAASGYYFVGWKNEDGKFWQATDKVEKAETLTATFEMYKGAVIDECVFKTDCFENTDFKKSDEQKAKGFENVYTKSITSNFTPIYSHIDTSYYNVLRFAVKTDALYCFNNFGATAEPRVYMDRYTDWTYWTLTKTADLTWNVKIAFGDEVVFDYTHSKCSANSICYMLYHGVSGGDFMILSYNYDRAYTIECTEVRAGEMPVVDTDGVDTSIGCLYKSSDGGTETDFEESSENCAPRFSKKYTKSVTGNFVGLYSHTDMSVYEEIRFAIRTTANYRFNNFGATKDPRVYITPAFSGWTYWILTQTADKVWNVKIMCGDTEVFNYTHSGCAENTICHVLYHGIGGYDFWIYPNDASVPYTIECTEVRGILKAEA